MYSLPLLNMSVLKYSSRQILVTFWLKSICVMLKFIFIDINGASFELIKYFFVLCLCSPGYSYATIHMQSLPF